MELRETRKQIGYTQPEAAAFLGIPFRTYCRYESEEQYKDTFKYNQMVSLLNEQLSNTVLKIETIKDVVAAIFANYKVSTCYLFGSYAKGKATSDSDIDLMIVSEIEGIEYYQLLNDLETKFGKKIDLLRLETAIQNAELMSELLNDGIKVY